MRRSESQAQNRQVNSGAGVYLFLILTLEPFWTAEMAMTCLLQAIPKKLSLVARVLIGSHTGRRPILVGTASLRTSVKKALSSIWRREQATLVLLRAMSSAV
jgi:hypothetical protein